MRRAVSLIRRCSDIVPLWRDETDYNEGRKVLFRRDSWRAVMTAAARRWRLRDAHRFAQLSPPRHHRGQWLDTVNHSRSGKVTTTTC